MTKPDLKIGTRGSLLALQQSGNIKRALESLWPGLRVELQVIKTTGDKILDVPLAKVGGKGLFVKEIEDALLAGEVDLAVHSIKDVPALLPEGLEIGVIPQREDPRDVLVSRHGGDLANLPRGARVGTSSLRRSAQLLRLRPDIEIEPLRGNLDTRLRKLCDGLYDGIVLAAAGLHRMGWEDRVSAYLETQEFVPAIGQGALGIEVRREDARVQDLLSPLHSESTAVAVQAERSLLRELEGGCQVPIGGHACLVNGQVQLTGLVASLDGRRVFCRTITGAPHEAEMLGRRLGQELLRAGARDVLKEIYGSGRDEDRVR